MECDRCQIQLSDGTWVMYLMFHSENRALENKKGVDNIDRVTYKETAFRDAWQWKIFVDDHTKVLKLSYTHTRIHLIAERSRQHEENG